MITELQPSPGTFDLTFRDRICRQEDLESAATTLAETARDLGWDLAAFHASVDTPDLPRNARGSFIAERMGWPSASLDVWNRFKLGRDCPLGTQCARSTEPFFWTCDERDASWYQGEFTRENRRVLAHYGRFVTSGVAVPVRRGGCTGFVSWSSCSGDARELAAPNLGSMFFISHVFIRHVEGLMSAQSRQRGSEQLTDREIECLKWAARGKSEEAIALKLSRSRDTVHFHLQNAVRKLDANNRTHAVAIACCRGLINLRE